MSMTDKIDVEAGPVKIIGLPKKYFLLLLAVLVIAIIAAVIVFTDFSCKTDKVNFESKGKLKSGEVKK